MARAIKSIAYLGLFGLTGYGLMMLAERTQEVTRKEISSRKYGFREGAIEKHKTVDGKIPKALSARQIIEEERLEKNKKFNGCIKAAADDPHPIYRPRPKDN